MASQAANESARDGLARIANPSEMVSRPGWLMRRLLPLFERVDFPLEALSRVKAAEREGPVVFVCERQSTLDYLYFNAAFLKLGLSLVWSANGVGTLLYRTLFATLSYLFARLFRRRLAPASHGDLLAAGLQAGRPNLLFLRPRRTLLQWGGAPVSEHLRGLIELQRDLERPVQIVPLSVIWDREPERHRRSVVDMLFGAPNAPGRIRKLVGFVRYHRKAMPQVSEPLDLRDFLRQRSGEERSPERLAEHLEYLLHRGLSQAARPLRGPVLKRSRDIREEILRTDAFQRGLERHAHDTGRPVSSVVKEAAGYLKEMAADFSIRYVEGMVLAIGFLWSRSFSGLDLDHAGLDRIREAAKQAPIILVPAHRSHIDYLAISWLFYNHGLIPPHIAAGINLSFWPMGHLFRRSGAFFLRRSFRDNPLYAMTFEAYMRKLVKEGYWVEFFIEGGRSRTGKCLPPKLGMLSNFVDALLDGATRELYFVPVSIGYERVIEERAYSRELSGADKGGENLGALLRSSKVLVAKHGRLNAYFHEPMSLRAFLEAEGYGERAPSPEERRRWTQRLGHRLIEGINRTTVVTTMSVVSTALLTHPEPTISRDRLGLRVGLLLDLASRDGATLASTLRTSLQARRLDLARQMDSAEAIAAERFAASGVSSQEGGPPRYQVQRVIDKARGDAVAEAIDDALGWMMRQKQIRETTKDGVKHYFVHEERRINLDMYKNAFLHHMVPQAFAATAILATQVDGAVSPAAVRRQARFLVRLFKYEFEYGERARFEERFAQTQRLFEEQGFLVPDGRAQGGVRVHPKADHLLRFFRNGVANFLESYWLVAELLPLVLQSPLSRKDLLRRLQAEGLRMFKEERRLERREAISAVNFQNALQFFEDRGFLGRDEKGRYALRRDARLFGRWAAHIRRLRG